jgi:SAM-dependent methyltransferase
VSDSAPRETAVDTQYLQRTVAGAEYFEYITSVESDRQARSVFQELVLSIAPPGGVLFDFGAGAGIDARFFAERGFNIEAYDVDPRMRDFFAEYCREYLDTGRIVLDSSLYREFVARRTSVSGHRADLVIANFAPLNLIDNLPEVFAKFASLTGRGGKVLASVLNPYCRDDLKFRWWWRNAPRLFRNGHAFMPGPQAPHYLRRPRNFGAMSAPHFRLVRTFPGARGGGWSTWPRRVTCRYLFLLFEKTS